MKPEGKEEIKKIVHDCVIIRDGDVCGFNFRKLDSYLEQLQETPQPIEEGKITLEEAFEFIRWFNSNRIFRPDLTDSELYQLFKQSKS